MVYVKAVSKMHDRLFPFLILVRWFGFINFEQSLSEDKYSSKLDASLSFGITVELLVRNIGNLIAVLC